MAAGNGSAGLLSSALRPHRLCVGEPQRRVSRSQRAVEERSATKIVWNSGTELDQEAAEQLRSLLQRKLTADDAVQIAMLNNRDLQAIYTELGVAQADLVQAGLFKNPILDAASFFHCRASGRTFSSAWSSTSWTLCTSRSGNGWPPPCSRKPSSGSPAPCWTSRRRFARAFYVHQANEQMLELRQTIVHALTASLEVSRRLHEAGNISDLDLARDRALTDASKVALRSAEIAARQSREQLNNLMGAWGEQTEWEIDGRLPEIPAEPLQVNGVERVALARSIDLSHARQRIIAAGQQLGLNRATALVPDLDARGRCGEGRGRGLEGGAGVSDPHSPLRSRAGADRPGRGGAAAGPAGVLRSGRADPLDGSGRRTIEC